MSTPFRMLRARYYLAVAVTVAASACQALSPARLSGTDISFQPQDAALTEDQRLRLQESVAKLQAENWCKFEAAITTGYSDRSEGNRRKQYSLALARAEYVANLLQVYGIPRSHIYASDGRWGDGSWPHEGTELEPHRTVSVEFSAEHEK